MPAPPLPAPVLQALARGNKIEAIALLRESTGLGLKEAKDAVEAWQRGELTAVDGMRGPVPASVTSALAAGNKIEAIRLYREHARVGLKEAKDAIDRMAVPAGAGLSPGEVPRSGVTPWVVAIVVVACAIGAWFLLR